MEWFDEVARGLSLKVSPGGSTTFYFHYSRRIDGVRRRIQIGPAPALALKEARDRARRLAVHVADGEDPVGDRHIAKTEMTGAELAARYLKDYAYKHKRSAKRDDQAIAKDVLPVIGELKVSMVTRAHIRKIMDRMIARGVTIGASRTFEIVRKMFSWGIEQDLAQQNPAQGMKRPFKTRIKDRTLIAEEIRCVWTKLPDAPMSLDTMRVIKLCLITAQRVGEVAGMQRSEVDFSARVWTIPAERSKNGFAHRVPLSDLAMVIISEAAQGTNLPSLFPGYGEDGSLRSSSVGKSVRRSLPTFGISKFTTHDLRRTAATFMGESGVLPHVIAHVLNHRSITRAKVTEQVYNKYEYAREKLHALESWSEMLAGIVNKTSTENARLMSGASHARAV